MCSAAVAYYPIARVFFSLFLPLYLSATPVASIVPSLRCCCCCCFLRRPRSCRSCLSAPFFASWLAALLACPLHSPFALLLTNGYGHPSRCVFFALFFSARSVLFCSCMLSLYLSLARALSARFSFQHPSGSFSSTGSRYSTKIPLG